MQILLGKPGGDDLLVKQQQQQQQQQQQHWFQSFSFLSLSLSPPSWHNNTARKGFQANYMT